MLLIGFSIGFLIRRTCVWWANSVTPASFFLIQCLNQLLNQQPQLRGVTFIGDRNTKFAPVLLHAVSHIHLRYSGANACDCCFVRSTFGATTLSGSVVYGSQRGVCRFHHLDRQFWGTGFHVFTRETVPFRRQEASSCLSPSVIPQSRGFCEDGELYG